MLRVVERSLDEREFVQQLRPERAHLPGHGAGKLRDRSFQGKIVLGSDHFRDRLRP